MSWKNEGDFEGTPRIFGWAAILRLPLCFDCSWPTLGNADNSDCRYQKAFDMRMLKLGLIIASSCVAGCQQTHEISEITWFTTEISQRKQYTDELAPDLASIASGIDVRFSENPVTASGPYTHRSGYYYSREYSVSVTSKRANAQIERWGVLELDDGRWKHARFSRDDFAAAFGCPDGVLVAGRSYTFGQAHQIGILPGKVRWYFVATDSRGERLKGEGLVESAAKDRQ